MNPAKLLSSLILAALLLFGVPARNVLADGATLEFSPSSGTIREGEALDVGIVVDTDGAEVGAVDIYASFDPSKFEISIDTSGGVFDNIYPASGGVNNDVGNITFSAFMGGGADPFEGSGTVATLGVTAKGSSGTEDLTFSFTLGRTDDCNVIDQDSIEDILTSVTDGGYVLAAAEGPTATPTVAPTTAPTTPTTTPTPTTTTPTTVVTTTATPTSSSSNDPTSTPTSADAGANGTGGGGATPQTGDLETSMFIALLGFSLLLSGILLVF